VREADGAGQNFDRKSAKLATLPTKSFSACKAADGECAIPLMGFAPDKTIEVRVKAKNAVVAANNGRKPQKSHRSRAMTTRS
jgi:hypothetical protein